MKDPNIIVCDDICDTADTLSTVKDALSEYTTKFVTMYAAKEGKKWIEENKGIYEADADRWVVFPYEENR